MRFASSHSHTILRAEDVHGDTLMDGWMDGQGERRRKCGQGQQEVGGGKYNITSAILMLILVLRPCVTLLYLASASCI